MDGREVQAGGVALTQACKNGPIDHWIARFEGSLERCLLSHLWGRGRNAVQKARKNRILQLSKFEHSQEQYTVRCVTVVSREHLMPIVGQIQVQHRD